MENNGGLEKGDGDNEVIDVATDYEESLLQVTPREGLRMLDQLVFVTGICKEDHRALFSKDRTLSTAYKKQGILLFFCSMLTTNVYKALFLAVKAFYVAKTNQEPI